MSRIERQAFMAELFRALRAQNMASDFSRIYREQIKWRFK